MYNKKSPPNETIKPLSPFTPTSFSFPLNQLFLTFFFQNAFLVHTSPLDVFYFHRYICSNLRMSRNFTKMTYKTEQRNLLLNFLKNSPDVCFTAKQISDALKNENISKSAVYRNLSELEKEEKIKRITKQNSKESFFQFLDTENCRNHIHLSCLNCGKIFHLENSTAQRLILNLEDAQGFEIDKEKSTLYGICKDCATRN